jgi:Cu+-exporting ATPase|tara:strand:- start:2159 stop:2329 length:171 start_codon:yes stop_codon:yes gene_type:complete
VHGVTDAEVSYDTERAKVHYDPNTVTLEQLVQAVNNTGFRASLTDKVEAEGVGPLL